MDLVGLINLNKPVGWTSHDAVAKIRRLSGQRRVGHAGTLDPLAQGVLPILLGRATRLMDLLQEGSKRYLAEVVLGAATSTDDAEGEVIARSDVPPLSACDIEVALDSFRGPIQQTPPAYSAIKVQGQRAYALARAGQQVELAPRDVTIEALTLVGLTPDRLTLDITCGSGTYIRSLARDLASALGTHGHLSSLVRTQVGPFSLDAAVTPDDVAASGVPSVILPPDAAVPRLPRVTLEREDAGRFAHGQAVQLPTPADTSEGRARVYGPSGTLIGIAAIDGGVLRPRISLLSEISSV